MTTYQAGGAWEALGDPSRLAIVTCLAERPRAVGELADKLPISRPAVSQHLKVLKAAGLVSDRAEGTRRVYRLNPSGLSALRDQLDTFLHPALAGYQQVVEDPYAKVAAAAKVSRAWRYSQPDVRAAVDRLRNINNRSTGVAVPARQRTSKASLVRRLAAAHRRNQELTRQVTELREQLAAMHGALRDTSRQPSAVQRPR
ncbi:metalloregulator ArsR/SmtB family transcription factor [Micromonospora sp. NPDC050495]|uniref:metalloregulator ArsR/SmtB family transcription factor n=1 Tax=Micromonospora sp. NPDC050495 TaxID=3154936 RepID=UPI0033EB9F8B